MLVLLLVVVACRSRKVEHDAGMPTASAAPIASAPPTTSASVATSPATDACASSCAAGVCESCPTEDIALAGKASAPTMLAIGPRKIAWNRDYGYTMFIADRCTRTVVPCKPGCSYERERKAEGLLLERSEARTASDGTLYSIDAWLDTISLPHKSGWMFSGATEYSSDSEGDFLIDGADAYFVDGSALKRVRKGTAPVTVLETKDEHAPMPFLKSGATLYAVKGWSSRTTYLPDEPFSIVAIEHGTARTLYANKGAGCFAANDRMAVVCIDGKLVRVPLSGKAAADMFSMDRKDNLTSDTPVVALADDGALAWSNPSERVVHFRQPAWCRAAAVTPASPADVVQRWNAAHNDHDASSLRALYAPTVSFYGVTLTNDECVRRKQAAFVASPDYAQTIRDMKIDVSGDRTTVRFVKTSTSKGKSTDYPSALVLRGGLVVEER